MHGALALGILILASEDVDVPLVELYTSARSAIEASTALSVAPFDLFSESPRQRAIKTCAGNGRCFLDNFRRSGVEIDLLLTLSVARLDERLLLGLRLADARTPSADEIAVRGVEVMRGGSVEETLKRELARVFPSDIWGQVASIEVNADPVGAEVRIDDQACVSPCRIERATPRTYEVSIAKAGFLAWRGNVDAKANEKRVLDVKLVPLAEESTPILESPWFWGAVGVAVLGLGTGLFVALRKRDESDVVCIGHTGCK